MQDPSFLLRVRQICVKRLASTLTLAERQTDRHCKQTRAATSLGQRPGVLEVLQHLLRVRVYYDNQRISIVAFRISN